MKGCLNVYKIYRSAALYTHTHGAHNAHTYDAHTNTKTHASDVLVTKNNFSFSKFWHNNSSFSFRFSLDNNFRFSFANNFRFTFANNFRFSYN